MAFGRPFRRRPPGTVSRANVFLPLPLRRFLWGRIHKMRGPGLGEGAAAAPTWNGMHCFMMSLYPQLMRGKMMDTKPKLKRRKMKQK